ncbi:unnamed protein product [Trifolium pratense]|uniref:Uncharacterized protein n=4 Tax=Trifolium pratense TaxID=57577 RepID=A0ACB0JMG1_TRIPR|nr:unnamed protein product [Trifolium pratense]CAJ2642552.1 unnamed protein product [Trifolium pratense]CAJ2644858.1 unnamed protein product [Trifolium pratense]CAJ2656779.1 unnamed protein product [Trifolium pratense]
MCNYDYNECEVFCFYVLLLYVVNEFLLIADKYKCCIFFRDIFPAPDLNDLLGHVECIQSVQGAYLKHKYVQ